MRKPGLSLEEHRALGARLKRLNDEMQDVMMQLSRVYPVKSYEVPILKVMHYLGRLRARMEDKMYSEHPDGASLDIYYGPREEPAAQRGGEGE